MARVKSLFQIIFPFVIVVFFMVLANAMQVIPFSLLRKLNVENFTLLNYSAYAITFLAVVTGSFERWLMIQLSKVPFSKRLVILKKILAKTVWMVPVTLILLGSIFCVLNPLATPYVLLSIFSTIIMFFAIFPKSLVVSKENYTFLGSLSIIEPLFRIVTVSLFVQNGNISPFFIGHVLSSAVAGVFSFFMFKRLVESRQESTVKPTKKLSFAMQEIFGQILLQVGISIFWIADGLLLKNVLPAQLYASYVTYAYILKFPLFITISFVSVLTIKNVFDKAQRDQFRIMMFLAVLLSILVFGGVGLTDTLFPGTITGLLGFNHYYLPGVLFLMSMTWLIHTIVTIFFTYLTKVEYGPRLILNVSSYAITFVIVLLIFNGDLFTLLTAILVQGIIFLFTVLLTQKSFLRS